MFSETQNSFLSLEEQQFTGEETKSDEEVVETEFGEDENDVIFNFDFEKQYNLLYNLPAC